MASNTDFKTDTPNDASSAAASAATLRCTEDTISLIPADDTFIVRRFLSDRDHRPPLGLEQALSEAEAETQMLVKLRAFDEKFSNAPARN